MNLQELLSQLSNYFFKAQISYKGFYWCKVEKIFQELENDQITISRFWEDWCIAIWDIDGHLEMGLAECYSGSELYRMCLLPGHEIEAILELVPKAQQIVECW